MKEGRTQIRYLIFPSSSNCTTFPHSHFLRREGLILREEETYPSWPCQLSLQAPLLTAAFPLLTPADQPLQQPEL